ncbi:MAG: peptidylprolyl isomerase [Symploca sp. SIO3C6]|uniref:peptidylprolyl isomerase n=1 Tax=Symploca sp. SIO1C4 TaxID=2607765 RepID=A0A6B3NBY5_9CYAN|nr:peptidylprolyl isomerase [Symploca sp. SIO3C6]NER28102.1 peptidylprolyl isomerase [Symploca sp. SIO1C4]NET06490.1 peptidylprolyl isomerase [Symploca sp. SIO2B6]
MGPLKNSWLDWCKSTIKTSLLALMLIVLSTCLSGAWWNSGNDQPARKSQLAVGDAITDAQAILRYALPIENQQVRDVQASIEDIAKQLRGKRWGSISRDISRAAVILSTRSDKLLADVPEVDQPQAEALISQLKDEIASIREAVEAKDREKISMVRGIILEEVGKLEQLMVKGFPFEVPAEYGNLPQLKGRATVEISTNKGDLTLIVDGYSAPVTAGNFVDLVNRGFYDGLEFIRAEDKFVVQTGDPAGSEVGFIDPNTGQYRAIPLEILVRGDEQPIYGITLEEAGIYLEPLALPFNAYGTIAMARPGNDPNGGSSQFFFFKFDTELTPPGFNLMDGRYAVFGYLVGGKNVLETIREGDIIESAQVIEGEENLVEPL